MDFADYLQEQEMEIEALQAILMEDIKELDDDGLETEARSFQITISSEEDDPLPVRVALVFAHTSNYPEEPPLIDVRGIKGIRDSEAKQLKEAIIAEAMDNLGMAMMYTLVTFAKEWLSMKFNQADEESASNDDANSEIDEVVEPHGEVVTVDNFLNWRESFEAEIALEKAKLMPDSALIATKEKRLTGRAWFENGYSQKAGKPVIESSDDEQEEDIDFDADFDDGDLDEDDMLEHYLSQKSEKR